MPKIVVGSEFFNDLGEWKTLRNTIHVQLSGLQSSLRLWSAGCYLGQEAYSLAIFLDELSPDVQHYILATDLDVTLLAKAMTGGGYIRADIQNLTDAQFQRYIQPVGPPYFVTPSLIKRVQFRKHNVTIDDYENNFDAIACRNVVRAFSEADTFNVYKKFYAALKPGGVLFVGMFDPSPTIIEPQFQCISQCVYRRTPDGD